MTKFPLTVWGSLLICCLLTFSVGKAQPGSGQPHIMGLVKGPDGAPLAGVTVAVTSNKRIATVTNGSGVFDLTLPSAMSGTKVDLEISFVGFEMKHLTAQAGESDLAIAMDNTRGLNEVVVTALGIGRQKKSIGYAVTEVKGSEFTQARENNIANALSGKVAGVNAAGLSTGPGGSSRVTIRGTGSLFGDNQPLYVINGMPIDNSVPGGAPTSNGITFNIDKGDGIGGINPDDIESFTVLKGGTAAALYGSRGANGVILITTKKGRAQKGVGVEYNTTGTLENVAVNPDFQYQYGQGDGGVKPTTLAASQATGRRSWGSKIDGSTDYVGVDGKTHPYTAKKDNLQNFYQTGKTWTNTVAMTGGNENVTYRFSLSDLNSKGILPNTTYDRKVVNLALGARLDDHLSIEALAQYNLEKGHGRTGAGDALGNPNWTPLEIANTADVRWLKPGYDSNGNEILWNDAAIASNGYFVANKYQENDTKNRFIGQASIIYKPIPNLTIKGTISQDHYDYNYSNVLPTGTLYVPNGQYTGLKDDITETNSLLTATYKAHIGDDIHFSVLAGANGRKFSENYLKLDGSTFTIPYFYSFANLATATTTPYNGHLTTNSAFGAADFDYKNLFFLSVTGRQDWFSTLSKGNYGIFYPSVGGSFILSDAVQLPSIFNLAKLRGSWAQAGGGQASPYQINLTYSNVPSSGQPLQNVTPDPNNNNTNSITNNHLLPYTSTTVEAGFELSMLKERLGIDVTLYDRSTKRDIFPAAVSTTSGYSNAIVNLANSTNMRNKGIELLLTGSIIKRKDFQWTASYNVSYNNNKVVSLLPGFSSIQVASAVGGWAYLNHVVGMPAFELVGTSMQKNANGDTVFNATSGLPVQSAQHNLGRSVAPWTMGMTQEFHYKRFGFSFLLDGKFGNKIFSIFEVYATRMGKLKTTLPGRENGLTVHGVDQAGNKYSNTIAVANLRPYYDNYKVYSDLFLHDGSFVKLRQVILSYSIPVNKLGIAKLQSANISFVSRNLFTLYKKTKNFDPEQSFTNSNSQGFESIGLPRTRTYGLNLSVKF